MKSKNLAGRKRWPNVLKSSSDTTCWIIDYLSHFIGFKETSTKRIFFHSLALNMEVKLKIIYLTNPWNIKFCGSNDEVRLRAFESHLWTKFRLRVYSFIFIPSYNVLTSSYQQYIDQTPGLTVSVKILDPHDVMQSNIQSIMYGHWFDQIISHYYKNRNSSSIIRKIERFLNILMRLEVIKNRYLCICQSDVGIKDSLLVPHNLAGSLPRITSSCRKRTTVVLRVVPARLSNVKITQPFLNVIQFKGSDRPFGCRERILHTVAVVFNWNKLWLLVATWHTLHYSWVVLTIF